MSLFFPPQKMTMISNKYIGCHVRKALLLSISQNVAYSMSQVLSTNKIHAVIKYELQFHSHRIYC
jgi:hypothetical protein